MFAQWKTYIESGWQEVALQAGLTLGRIALIAACAFFVLWLIKRFGNRAISRWSEHAADGDDIASRGRVKRRRTLLSVFMASVRVLVLMIALFYALSTFGFDYAPLLVAAGGISLALGFGAQSLVRDFFSGFFILLENQYGIGDVVEVSGRQGTVEDLSLRTTTVRDLNGDLYIIPNGEIKLVVNKTRSWSRAIVDLRVAVGCDVDAALDVLRKAGLAMRIDANWSSMLIGEVVVLGIEATSDSSLTVRTLLKSVPGEQWAVAREFRRRALAALARARIDPTSAMHIVTHSGVAQKQAGATAREAPSMPPASVEQADREAAVDRANAQEDRSEAA